jgi:hypothetical protein
VAAIYPMALAWVQARSDTWKVAERSLTTALIVPGGRAGTGREGARNSSRQGQRRPCRSRREGVTTAAADRRGGDKYQVSGNSRREQMRNLLDDGPITARPPQKIVTLIASTRGVVWRRLWKLPSSWLTHLCWSWPITTVANDHENGRSSPLGASATVMP